MWFFVAVFGMIITYISGRRWGLQIYNYYRPQIAYILSYARRKYRSSSLALQSAADISSDNVNVKKKFDLETVIIIILSDKFGIKIIFLLLPRKIHDHFIS